MENYENYSQSDLYELFLLNEAKQWIKFAKTVKAELNPWENEAFFDIPTYLRDQAELKTFYIYLKSFTMEPDYEDQCQAKTKKEAIEIFYKKLGKYGWEKNILAENIAEESERGLPF